MKFLIKKFKIIEIKTRKYNEFTFSEKVNIIAGNNTDGKSTLIKSIMFSLGFEIKKWAEKHNEKDFIYSCIISVDEKQYTITRFIDNFIVNDTKIMSLKEYRQFLVELLNLKISFIHKQESEEKTNKIIPYPTDIFLYNYIDQDSSFESFLYRSNYKNYFYATNEWINMYKYFIGIYDEELDSLSKQLSDLKKEINNLNNEKKSFEKMLTSLKISIENEEYISLNTNEFEKEIKLFTKKITEITNSKKTLEFQKIISINKLRTRELEKMHLENIYNELDKTKEITCQLCHNKISNSFIEHYNHEIDKQYILESYTNCIDEIKTIEKNIKEIDSQIAELSEKLDKLKKIKEKSKKSMTFDEIIDKNSKLKISLQINNSIDELGENISVKDLNKKTINEKIKILEKKLKEKEEEIKTFYQEELLKMNAYFSKSNLTSFQEEFLKFNIKGTGVSILLKKISLYYIYIKILIKYSKIKFPIIWDSVIKDALDNKNGDNLEKFVNEELLQLDTQIIFSNIPNASKDVKILLKEINIIDIHKEEYYNKICCLDNTSLENNYIDSIFHLLGNEKNR